MKMPRPAELPAAPADGVKRKHRRMYLARVPAKSRHSRRNARPGSNQSDLIRRRKQVLDQHRRNRQHEALPEPRIPPLDPPGDRVHVLDPVSRYFILQRLPDAIERPRTRRDAIVNRDAHVGPPRQFPVLGTDGRLPVPSGRSRVPRSSSPAPLRRRRTTNQLPARCRER